VELEGMDVEGVEVDDVVVGIVNEVEVEVVVLVEVTGGGGGMWTVVSSEQVNVDLIFSTRRKSEKFCTYASPRHSSSPRQYMHRRHRIPGKHSTEDNPISGSTCCEKPREHDGHDGLQH
jgi:hypothetical protein